MQLKNNHQCQLALPRSSIGCGISSVTPGSSKCSMTAIARPCALMEPSAFPTYMAKCTRRSGSPPAILPSLASAITSMTRLSHPQVRAQQGPTLEGLWRPPRTPASTRVSVDVLMGRMRAPAMTTLSLRMRTLTRSKRAQVIICLSSSDIDQLAVALPDPIDEVE
ncbi:hypothetical protein COCNU_09G006770 [Cocos nucifera]|uniref:Uncharacterized protein n=1 Tax=Cocos nucifera TaxID=13894 RepID=A0A8K0IKU1_COCNU|nr:hypothetical protein COCNU_09G006770 [Cocos nucifera]